MIATGGGRRIVVVAREEFRVALEGRWLFGFAALLTALVFGLSFFGLAQAREVGFQGFARVTLSLMNLVLFVVPLAGCCSASRASPAARARCCCCSPSR